MENIFVVSLVYLSGSIPFGFILTKFFIKKDVRTIGSGNIGATNVLRAGNKYLAITTLILDVIKGYAPIIIVLNYFPHLVELSALVVFLGHVFPVWLKFKGGKGVATYLGILLALSFASGLLFIFTWAVVSLIFKYSSVSSIFSSLTVLAVTFLKENVIKAINPDIIFTVDLKLILFIFFILIIFTHRKNISNLKNKTEKKIKL